MKTQTITKTAEETLKIGEQLGRLCKGGEIICLSGDLGAGKTTFVKGIARGLKINEKTVNSPTFVIMNVYEKGRLPLYHFDLYRFDDPKEIGVIGYDEFLYSGGVAVVEWAERFGHLMPPENLAIHLGHEGESSRSLEVKAHGQRYEDLIKNLRL